ncbi:hypothetical protein DID75_01405 [Candidatus Marinamargulisbacteria bacterium SCGC AG-410-N11]|nr:hypothetical protein DID75_01405 [Candidatus Marinamargulisbacteria bacterium SCGC AG-410-N11]
MKKTASAGGVVLNTNKKVLLVKQQNNVWSLPKGHVEHNESVLDAAKREIEEESGINELTLVLELGSYQRYKIGKDGNDDQSELKEIFLFLFLTNQQHLSPHDPDNPEAIWVNSEDVKSYLTHEKDIEFYESKLSVILGHD